MTDLDTARAAAESALAFWNNGRGHHDPAWVERMAYNGFTALRSLLAALASREAETEWEYTVRDPNALESASRAQITDDMVTRAAASVHEWGLSDVTVLERAIARAALEAALNNQSNEQGQSNG